ncbi:MAG: 50S ribosomal protein L10 [Ignavibacteria bacterium]|nr:50S ribosomal protein L10 [Ignavibacteria bacterium]
MITKQQKKERVSELVDKFKKATSYYFIDFTGMNVENTLQFRRELKKNKMEFKVSKNTLIRRALEEFANLKSVGEQLRGPTGIVFAFQDPIEPARLLKERIEKFQQPVFKKAVVEGAVYEADQLKLLASLPSKGDVVAGIMGSISSPISGIINSIAFTISGLASVIEEVAKKRTS